MPENYRTSTALSMSSLSLDIDTEELDDLGDIEEKDEFPESPPQLRRGAFRDSMDSTLDAPKIPTDRFSKVHWL